MVLPFIACYCICYIRNCVVFGNVVFFCALFFRVFTSVVWFCMYGVGITKYCGVRCKEVFHKAFHKVFHKVLKSISQSISQSI